MIQLIQDAYRLSTFLVTNCKDLIYECAGILKTDRILRSDDILGIIMEKYPHILDLRTF